MSQNFQVGDIVEAFGCRGTIVSLSSGYRNKEITVSFNGYSMMPVSFDLDGKYEPWHKEPSLKLIEKPKKKIKKKIKKTMYQAVIKTFDVNSRRAGLHLHWAICQNADEAKEMFGEEFVCLGPAIKVEVEAQ